MGKGSVVTDLDVKCIKAYADCGMNYFAAARMLYLQRNTMAYHLEKVQKVTGLNPKSFYDLVKLLILYANDNEGGMSNADRIRDMSNNELAKFLVEVAWNGKDVSWTDALEWLNRPVGGNENEH